MIRLVLALAGAAAILASGAAAEPAASEAKKCPRGKARVTLAGKPACRPVAQVVPRRRAGNGLAPALRTGLDPTWGETRDGPKSLSDVAGPERTRAIERSITAALEAFERQGGRRHLASAARAAAGCSSSQVLPETSSAYKQAMEGGGEFSVQMTTGAGGANVEMSATVPLPNGRAVRITVDLALCAGERLEVKECPTNQGVVEGTDNTTGTIKVEQLEGGAVVESSSTKIAIATKLRGEVETDAKLRFLEIDRTESFTTSVDFGRWVGATTQTTLRRRATLSMPSGSVVAGTGSLDVQQSFRGLLSFLVDRVAARNAAIAAAQKASDEAWAKFTDEAVKKYRERESEWQKPGTCAELEFAPKSNTLRVRLGQQGLFTGTVKAKRGGAAEGRWKVTARSKLGVRPAGDPSGARVPWRYRVDGEGKVSVTYRVTSKAGVATGTWEQGGSELPQRITGTFSGSSGDSVASISWTGTITFVRDATYSGPGRAGYAVERVAYTSTYSINEPHTGCRGRGTGSASLGKQGAGTYLLLDRAHVDGKHRYEINASLQGPATSITVVCPYGSVTQPWPPSALLFTAPATFRADSRTWTFSGTHTIPGGGGATTTMTWSLRGAR